MKSPDYADLDPGQGSLFGLLAAPVFIADGDGRLVYANPALSELLGRDVCPRECGGEELEAVFEGGARESVLQALVTTLGSGESSSFRLRVGQQPFTGFASPLRFGRDRVGVVVMLGAELPGDAVLQGVHAEIDEPIAEGVACLEELIEQTGGRRGERHRAVVERGLAALERARKRCAELRAHFDGQPGPSVPSESCDLGAVLRQVRARLERDFTGAGVPLDLLIPPDLPRVQAHAARLENALVHLLRQRLAETGGGHCFLLSARATVTEQGHALLVSAVDLPGEGGARAAFPAPPEPASVREAVATPAGGIHTHVDPALGRATVLHLRNELDPE